MQTRLNVLRHHIITTSISIENSVSNNKKNHIYLVLECLQNFKEGLWLSLLSMTSVYWSEYLGILDETLNTRLPAACA